MHSYIQYLRQHSAVRFAAVGAISTVIDYLILNFLLWAGLYKLIAVTGGFVGGATNGYLLNSHFVFYKQRNPRHFLRYFLVASIGLGLTVLIVYALSDSHHWLVINKAKAVAVGVVFFWNYLMSRLWAFQD